MFSVNPIIRSERNNRIVENGYWMGGKSSGPTTWYSDISAIDFNTESAFNPSANLGVGRTQGAPLSGTLQGLMYGGTNSGNFARNNIDGIKFNTEAAVTHGAAIQAISGSAGCCSRLTKKAYSLAGIISTSATTTAIDGFDFVTELAINPSATLTAARGGTRGIMNDVAGYSGGGSSQDDIYGFTFSTEASFNPSKTLSGGNVNAMASASTLELDKGYWAGGSTSVYFTNISGFTLGTETVLTVSAVLSVERANVAGVGSKLAAYFGGGENFGGNKNTIDGLTFATETAINPSAVLSGSARYGTAGVQEWPQI